MGNGDRYVTVTPAVKAGKFNVSIRKEIEDGEYMVIRISAQMPEDAAKALAKSWAAAMRLEIR